MSTTALTALDQKAEEIRLLLRRTTQNIVEIGQKLIEAKAEVGHGNFGDWLDSELDISESLATKFMQVGRQFKNVNFTDLNIAASALYLLAAPSTPEAVRGAMLAKAQSGERITQDAVKEAVAATKPQTLIINPEISTLWADVPISPEQDARLEDSILKHGCLDGLLVWQGMLVDGHRRYAICHKHGIPFRTHEIKADSFEGAVRAAYSAQLLRKNLTPEESANLRASLREQEATSNAL